jgi:hypothetical protein
VATFNVRSAKASATAMSSGLGFKKIISLFKIRRGDYPRTFIGPQRRHSAPVHRAWPAIAPILRCGSPG